MQALSHSHHIKVSSSSPSLSLSLSYICIYICTYIIYLKTQSHTNTRTSTYNHTTAARDHTQAHTIIQQQRRTTHKHIQPYICMFFSRIDQNNNYNIYFVKREASQSVGYSITNTYDTHTHTYTLHTGIQQRKFDL